MKGKQMDISTPQKRLKFFIDKKFGTSKAFCSSMGISAQYLQNYINAGKSMMKSARLVNRLTELQLNVNWYYTGEGGMLLHQYSRPTEPKEYTGNGNETKIKFNPIFLLF